MYFGDEELRVYFADKSTHFHSPLGICQALPSTCALSHVIPYFFLERYMSAYAAEWNSFVEALVQGKAVPVSLKDGVDALAMAEAATRSIKSGGSVKLDELD